MPTITWKIPLKTVSEANLCEHWSASSKRHRTQQFFIRELFRKETQKAKLPCIVRMTRLASHMMDDDNLRTAFKWIRDEISECLVPTQKFTYTTKSGRIKSIKGRADSDPRIMWEYGQEKDKVMGIRIEIIFMEDENGALETNTHADQIHKG